MLTKNKYYVNKHLSEEHPQRDIITLELGIFSYLYYED